MPVHHNPQFLPIDLNYGLFAKELAQAQYAIGLLQGSQDRLHNAMHLIGPLVAMEAAVSSKIEGTQSTSSDVYVFAAGGQPAHHDTPVVSNYRTAMFAAIEEIQDGGSINNHLIKSLHQILLKDVRHKGILGDYRNAPVWIAEKEGDPIESALYIPPEHVHIPSYMEDLFKYIEAGTDLNLVKAGVVHYQFEAIHPFEDGNGRIGRLLIPLILFYKGELSLPIVYSSGYFEARPQKYRDALRHVDKTGEYEHWLKFFFEAITEQAKETLKLINSIHELNNKLHERYENSKSPYISRLIDLMFKRPAFTIPTVMQKLGINNRLTVVRLVNQLEKDGVVIQLQGQKGPKGTNLYLFTGLVDLIS